MPGRRFRRRKSNSDVGSNSGLEATMNTSTNSYPTRTESVGSDYAQTTPENFVTQPPKPAKGLTGKISTLFRRESSRERSNDAPAETAAAVSTNHESPSSPTQRSRSADGARRRSFDSADNHSVRSHGKRIFYSSHQDDDSDDSFESRASKAVRRRTRSLNTATDASDDYTRSVATGDYSSYTDGQTVKMIKRYRGFSTSIKSLFLDESLVCGAFGCFGLILSNRTEYLLQLRNERRGAVSPRSSRSIDRKRTPSRIIARGLVLTLLLMFLTFVIWGFGTGNSVAGDYLDGYDYNEGKDGQNQQEKWWDDYLYKNDDGGTNQNYNDDAGGNGYNAYKDDGYAKGNDDGGRRKRELNQAQQNGIRHQPYGIFKIRDYQETIWDPVIAILGNEWYRDDAELVIQTRRRDEESTYDAYDYGGNNSTGSSSSYQNSYRGYQKRRDIASDIRVALFFAFLLFLGVLGRRRRMRTRFYLVRARAQEDHLYYASSDAAAARRVAFDDTREDQYEGACSHTLCGCYPVDEMDVTSEDEEDVEVTDMGIFKRKKKPYNEDIVARTFNCFMTSCCGAVFKCWFQCLSICALAQEAREVRLLTPPRYQRIDYITHQPFHEYQEAVNDLRRGWLGKARRVSGIMPHFNALSRLSRYTLILSFITVITIAATLMFNPRAAFSWQDVVVLVATFLQSFLVLFFVHWIFHKSDLSLDAVIKMFAAGFLIAVPTAFFFEGLMVNIVMFATWIFYDCLASIIGENFTIWVFDHWRAIWIIGELFNAYIVAAVTEELCKYYTFRSVEHPDLVFLTGLQRDDQDAAAIDGGIVKYPFASHQVQELSRGRSDVSISDRSHRSSRSHRSRSRSQHNRCETLLERTGTTDSEFDEDELDARTRRQKAMAITTGMISVAVGLACAENFLYVFVLGGALGQNDSNEAHSGDLLEAWIVLFFRSIFPVHALAAAMQSINMIRKFVEHDNPNGHRVGVGRIILPAVILHGSFDAVLMGINVFVETSWDDYLEENDGTAEPYNAFAVNLVAWICITAIMIGGLLWYYRENRKQRTRLKVLEEQDKTLQAGEWVSTAKTRVEEIV